ncbi:hypothetical protein RDWZM_008274 [Blomia tropicalis]|uniref:Uncharacterized protein n=1 Tax=Blomia tropicalis TaxID=40697 RepID=A0A9Q0M1G4_BLOTA|nr:hypothetical protein RDWZM_008274 [Blomia tropicalis]
MVESERIRWYPKDGELCLGKTKPEETLVEDRSFFTTPAPHHDSSSSDQCVHAQAEHFSDDPKIIPLLDDLRRMHHELQRVSLKPYKMVFGVEGLDQLLASIFINLVSAVHRIKPTGIKRSCRASNDIQGSLAAITRTRELALDYARHTLNSY